MAHITSGGRVGWFGWRSALGALLLGAVVACGGSGGGGGGPPPGSGALTATIDGQAFASDASAATATVTASAPGFYALAGTKSTNLTTISLALYNLTVPGTYPLGVTGVMFGGLASVSEAVPTWLTPLSGASGTVTVSTLTASRIVGTFAFTAAAPLDPTSTRTVTNGSFDLPVTGTAGTLPPNRGSSMTAQMNGASWTAAALSSQSTPGVLILGGATLVGPAIYSVTFTIVGVNGPGTYALSNPDGRTLSVMSGTQFWSSQSSAATGQVVVTDFSTTRAKGTFTATIQPSGGTTVPLTITNGSFNAGLP